MKQIFTILLFFFVVLICSCTSSQFVNGLVGTLTMGIVDTRDFGHRVETFEEKAQRKALRESVQEPVMLQTWKSAQQYATSKREKEILEEAIIEGYQLAKKNAAKDTKNLEKIYSLIDDDFVDIGMTDNNGNRVLWAKYDFCLDNNNFLASYNQSGSIIMWGDVTGESTSEDIPKVSGNSGHISGDMSYDIVAKYTHGKWRTPTIDEFSQMAHICKPEIVKEELPSNAKFDAAGNPIDLLGQWDCVNTEIITNRGSINTASILTFEGPLVRASYMINSSYRIDYEGPYDYNSSTGDVSFGKYKLKLKNGVLKNGHGETYNHSIKGTNRTTTSDILKLGPFSLNLGADAGWTRTRNGGLIETGRKYKFTYWTSSYSYENGKILPKAFYISGWSKLGLGKNLDLGEEHYKVNKRCRIRPVKIVNPHGTAYLRKGTPVSFRLMGSYSQKDVKIGDLVFFQVTHDVIVEDGGKITAITAGSVVSSHVVSTLNKGGQTVVQFDFIHLSNGKLYKIDGEYKDTKSVSTIGYDQVAYIHEDYAIQF